MLRTAIVIAVFGLLAGGCASDSKMDDSANKSSTSTRDRAISSPSTAGSEAAQSNSISQSRASRSMGVPSGAEEQDTLEACLGRIPRDATAGQRMLAEQSCRRDYAGRP
jgi:hypothetical protein